MCPLVPFDVAKRCFLRSENSGKWSYNLLFETVKDMGFYWFSSNCSVKVIKLQKLIF